MNKAFYTIFLILLAQPCFATEIKYGLELAPLPVREKHLNHFISLFQEFCFGQSSQNDTERNVLNSKMFRPAKGYDGIYEQYFEGLSYAVTPDDESCTVDVLLEFKSGKLLFYNDDVQSAIQQKTGYSLNESIKKIEEGPNAESVKTIEAHFQNSKNKNEIVLTYPTSNQDVFYMTLDYYYK